MLRLGHELMQQQKLNDASGKLFNSGFSLTPASQGVIAVSLPRVTVITHIEQYIEMFCKKDIDDCQDGLFNHWVMSRTNLLHLLNDASI